MRVKCIEIHWHDGKPIATCDFQPLPFKKARPTAGGERSFTRQTYKLATGGEDNHVRVRIISLGRHCDRDAESSMTWLCVALECSPSHLTAIDRNGKRSWRCCGNEAS